MIDLNDLNVEVTSIKTPSEIDDNKTLWLETNTKDRTTEIELKDKKTMWDSMKKTTDTNDALDRMVVKTSRLSTTKLNLMTISGFEEQSGQKRPTGDMAPSIEGVDKNFSKI